MQISWLWFLTFIVLYCRAFIILVFVFSSAGKVLHFDKFRHTISALGIVPDRYSGILALLVPGAELIAVVLLLLDHQFTFMGLSLSAFLLMAFTTVIAHALHKGTITACNCFGLSDDVITPYHIARNILLIAVALVALLPYLPFGISQIDLAPTERLLVSLMALISVGILVNLQQITRIIRLH